MAVIRAAFEESAGVVPKGTSRGPKELDERGVRVMDGLGRGGWIAMALLALVAAGCEAQVGEDYEGEVLLTLEGNVKLDPETELLPKLAFYGQSSQGVDIIDAEVSGDFPAKFRLDVTRPPPDSALIRGEEVAALGMKGSAGVGFLVMLPPGHPSTIPSRAAEGASEDCDAEGVCLVTQNACTADGACRVRKLRCTERQCELFGTFGDPALKEAGGGPGQGWPQRRPEERRCKRGMHCKCRFGRPPCPSM